MAKLKLLLAEFCKQHHLDELRANGKGIYRVTIDDMKIECFEKLNKGYFCSELMTLPEQANDLPIVLKDLMNHALFRTKSQNCCLGLGKDGNLILFERFDLATMNLYYFSETLEKFTNALEEYRHFTGLKNIEHPPANTMIIAP